MRSFCLFMILLLSAVTAFGQTAILPDETALPGNVHVNPVPDVIVLPEVAQSVEMNNADFNRIVCPGVIQDIVASKEKGLTVKYTGNNAFIKFKYLIKDGKPIYAKNPVDLNIVCDEDVYTIIAVPKQLAASPKIVLTPGKKKNINQNRELFTGMSHEKRILQFVKLARMDKLPASFDITRSDKPFDMFKGLELILRRVVHASGEGLRMREYEAKNITKNDMHILEKDFLKTELTSRPVAVSLSKMILKPDDVSRIFIIERTGDEHE
jgi:conjugal transfer pilus assembly protein TraK